VQGFRGFTDLRSNACGGSTATARNHPQVGTSPPPQPSYPSPSPTTHTRKPAARAAAASATARASNNQGSELGPFGEQQQGVGTAGRLIGISHQVPAALNAAGGARRDQRRSVIRRDSARSRKGVVPAGWIGAAAPLGLWRR
jgi:hypothetical protein